MKRGTKGKVQETVSSSLLSPQESERLEELLGRRCLSLSSAVVQLLMALPSDPTRWTPQQSGVVCFVKDSPLRSFFIRLYDVKICSPQAGKLVWEQEIYNQLMYKRVKPFFHTFTGDDCQVGLNFADVTEAESFFTVLEEKIIQRNNRFEKQNRKGSESRDRGSLPPLPPPNGFGTPSMPPMVPIIVQNQITPTKSKKEKKEKEKKNKKKGSKLLKGAIGAPSGFTHVSHLGMSGNSLDPDLKKLLSSAGISEADLDDSETSQLIYDVIERSGGMEAIKKVVNKQESPRPPAPGGHRGSLSKVPAGFSTAPSSSQNRALPPVPGGSQSSVSSATRASLPPTPPRGHLSSVPSPQTPESRGGSRSANLGPLPPVPAVGRNGPLPQPLGVRSGPLPPPPGGRSEPVPPPPGQRKESLTPVPGRRAAPQVFERRGSTLAPPATRSGPLPPPPKDNSEYLPPPPSVDDISLPPPPPDFFPPPPEDFNSSLPPPVPAESNFPSQSNRQHFTPPPPPISAKPSAGGPPPPPPPPPTPAAPPPMSLGSNTSSSGGNAPPPSESSGGRGALLAQIQTGMKLKKVTTNPDPPSPSLDTSEGIVGALMMVMQKRSKVIHSSDDDDEFDDEEDDDEEWD